MVLFIYLFQIVYYFPILVETLIFFFHDSLMDRTLAIAVYC